MDIHVDICGFLEIHAWICYGFSDQGMVKPKLNLTPKTHGPNLIQPNFPCPLSTFI